MTTLRSHLSGLPGPPRRPHAPRRPRSAGPARPSALALAAALAVAPALALQGASSPLEAQVPAPPQDRPVALVGGTIHTVSDGRIPSGTLVFEDGVITAVGADVEIPGDAERIDVTGLHVYPGLIDGYSSLGLFEIGGFDVAIDVNELGNINPNVRAEVAFNPETRHLGTTRSNGVLVAVSSPSGGIISGLAAAMALEGWTWEEMVIRPATGLVVGWPNPQNRERYDEDLAELREAFQAARAYRTAREAASNGGPHLDHDARWEAMIPVLEGEVPVMAVAGELRQIQDAVTWSEEEGVRLVIVGGADAEYVADHLVEKDIPVLLTSVLTSPNRQWEPYDHAYGLPARLHRAGVRFGIVGGSSAPYANRLPYEAGAAVAFGLPEEEAVRAVTLSTARILGIDDRVGSLQVGRDATLLVTTGNPLDYPTTIERIFIRGRDADLMDAHREFYEKYSEKVRQVRDRR